MIRLINEMNPPKPSFHQARMNAASPVPQNVNRIMLKGSMEKLDLPAPSNMEPIKKNRQNNAITVPTMRAVQRMAFKSLFFITFNFVKVKFFSRSFINCLKDLMFSNLAVRDSGHAFIPNLSQIKQEILFFSLKHPYSSTNSYNL